MPRYRWSVRRRLGYIDIGGLGFGGPRRLPIISLQGSARGPTVVVTANVHGDECTGLHAVHHLDQLLTDAELSGTVHLLPSLNPAGLVAGSRFVPTDEGDLNRSFPGRAAGDPTERLADAIWRTLSRLAPVAVVDLHTDSLASIPYAIIDRAVARTGKSRVEMDKRLDACASATGLTVIREYPDEAYVRFQLDRSLAGALVNRLGTPAVTVECGPRRIGLVESVQTAVRAVSGILDHLGILNGPVPPHATRVQGGPWRRTSSPRTRFSGVWMPKLRPGETFERGAVLGTVRTLSGVVREEMRAPEAGLVVSWSETSWVTQGAVVGTLGVVDR